MPLKEVEHEYPHYPDAAKKNRLEGTCVVRYTVGKNGRIIDIAILNHAVDPMFDEETLNTIRTWRYRPMMVNGKPVDGIIEPVSKLDSPRILEEAGLAPVPYRTVTRRLRVPGPRGLAAADLRRVRRARPPGPGQPCAV